MTATPPAISGPCHGGRHYDCPGNVEVGRQFVRCECPVNGCECQQAQAGSDGPGMTVAQRKALHG